MGLRMFHLLFIAISVVLLAFCAAWAIGEYRSAQGAGYAAASVGAVAGCVGLAIYGAAFQRKTRHL